jgi:nucleoid-associated protein YgaU
MDKKIHTDDLIPDGQEPIIIKQEGGGDRKFIYTLLILLVILFIIALGIIVFLSTKFLTNEQKGYDNTKIEKNIQPPPKELSKPQNEQKGESGSQKFTEDELSNLENTLEADLKNGKKLTQKSVEERVQEVASSRSKKLSPEEIAEIAKLVAQELKKAQESNTPETKKEDKKLLENLQSADEDTLDDKDIDIIASLDIDKVDKDTKVKDKKKGDNFNKVIIDNSGNSRDDEEQQMTKEIDLLLQSEEVQKEEEKLTYKKELDEEAKNREKALRFIIVKPGDTLGSIARRAYGRASAYVKIYKANPDLLKSPDQIYVGMKLRVPVDEEYVGK